VIAKKNLIYLFLLFLLFSCKKENLDLGMYELTVKDVSYNYNNTTYEINDFPIKDVLLVKKSEHLLTFESDNQKNYLTIDEKNNAHGVWFFNPFSNSTCQIWSYVLYGKIEKKRAKWIISGDINFVGKHNYNSGTNSINITANGVFLINRKK